MKWTFRGVPRVFQRRRVCPPCILTLAIWSHLLAKLPPHTSLATQWWAPFSLNIEKKNPREEWRRFSRNANCLGRLTVLHSFFYFLLHICIYFHSRVGVNAACRAGTMEAGRGHRIAWCWRKVVLVAWCRCWELNSGPSGTAASAVNHWAASGSLVLGVNRCEVDEDHITAFLPLGLCLWKCRKGLFYWGYYTFIWFTLHMYRWVVVRKNRVFFFFKTIWCADWEKTLNFMNM